MIRQQGPQDKPKEADRKPRASHRATMLITAGLLLGLLLYAWGVILRHNPKSLIGKPLPSLVYTDLWGAEHRVSDHREGPFLLVVVRTDCAPCERFLRDLSEGVVTEAGRARTLTLYLQRPETDKTEAVKQQGYPFASGFVRKLRDAAVLEVIVVPTAFLAVDGRIVAVEYGRPDRLNSLVEMFHSRFQ